MIKKIMLFFIVVMTIVLLAACQPTPKKLVVQNKGDGELEQAIVQTAAPTEVIVQTEEPKSAPIIINDISSNAQTL